MAIKGRTEVIYKGTFVSKRSLCDTPDQLYLRHTQTYWNNRTYSKVLNNSAARLLIFKIFSYQPDLIWTYTLIKIQTIFLNLTCLLSTIFYPFLSIFNAFCSLVLLELLQWCIFSCIFILLLVSSLKNVLNCFKKMPTNLSHFENFLPTWLLGPTHLHFDVQLNKSN